MSQSLHRQNVTCVRLVSIVEKLELSMSKVKTPMKVTTMSTTQEVKQTFASPTEEQLYNAREALKQIEAQRSHLLQCIAKKEQEVEDLAIPVDTAELKRDTITDETAQVVLRLKYAQGKVMIATGTTEEHAAKDALTEVEREYTEKERARQKAKHDVEQAEVTYDAQRETMFQQIVSLQHDLTLLDEQQATVNLLLAAHHAQLGQERYETLKSQIEDARATIAHAQVEIDFAETAIHTAQSEIASHLREWPHLCDELHATHGKIAACDDPTTRILESWLAFVATLQADGTQGTHTLPEDVTRVPLHQLVYINEHTLQAFFRSHVLRNQQKELIEMVLHAYRSLHHLPGSADAR